MQNKDELNWFLRFIILAKLKIVKEFDRIQSGFNTNFNRNWQSILNQKKKIVNGHSMFTLQHYQTLC